VSERAAGNVKEWGRGGSRCPAFSQRQKEWVVWAVFSLPVKRGFALRGMVPSPAPKRDHGDPQTFRLEARAKESWCGRRDYYSCSVGGSFFFDFFRLMLIAVASRLFLRWEA